MLLNTQSPPPFFINANAYITTDSIIIAITIDTDPDAYLAKPRVRGFGSILEVLIQKA
jgi:hypothetical protein